MEKNDPRKRQSIMSAYPKIASGRPSGLDDIIIQAKIDGSQCTVVLKDGKLFFYNKGSPIKGNKIFQNTILSLSNKLHLFKEGYIYHGEAVGSTQHNIAKYARTPNYFWIVYEIIRDDGYALDQQEMEELLEGTGIEMVDLLYSGPPSQEVIDDIMQRQPETCLGGGAEGFEGIVIKRMRRAPFYRRKIVSATFREEREPTPAEDAGDDVHTLGAIYNVPARLAKARQRLKELDQAITDAALEQELDLDLLKEQGVLIKDKLFCRFFNRMINGARAAYMGQDQPTDIPELVGYQHAGVTASASASKGIPEFIEQTKQRFAGPDGDLLREILWSHYGNIILEASRSDLRKPGG